MMSSAVIFCGENPEIRLVRPDDVEHEIAFASYWRCAYSPLGGGHFLALHVEPHVLDNHPDGITILAADKPPLGRMLADDLVRHFPGLGHIPFTEVTVETATLSQSSDRQTGLRVESRTAQNHINLTWDNLLDVRLPQIYAGFIHEEEHGTVLDVSNVICPVAGGSIVVNGAEVNGRVHSFHDGSLHRSSAFLAFSETWVRRPLAMG